MPRLYKMSYTVSLLLKEKAKKIRALTARVKRLEAQLRKCKQ